MIEVIYSNGEKWTYTTTPQCKHENGWYDTVRILGFEKKVFVCTDCTRIISRKQLHKELA